MPPFLAKDLCLSLDQLHKFMLIWLVLEQDPRDHQPQPGLQALAFGSVQKQVWQRFAACWWAILRACTGQCVISKFDALLHRSSIGKGARALSAVNWEAPLQSRLRRALSMRAQVSRLCTRSRQDPLGGKSVGAVPESTPSLRCPMPHGTLCFCKGEWLDRASIDRGWR